MVVRSTDSLSVEQMAELFDRLYVPSADTLAAVKAALPESYDPGDAGGGHDGGGTAKRKLCDRKLNKKKHPGGCFLPDLFLRRCAVGRGAVLGGGAVGADTVLSLAPHWLQKLAGLALCRLCRSLCRLCRFTALAESLLHLLHIRGGEHIAAALAGLIGQLVVDGDDVLQQQDGHHHQFIAEADRNGPRMMISRP